MLVLGHLSDNFSGREPSRLVDVSWGYAGKEHEDSMAAVCEGSVRPIVSMVVRDERSNPIIVGILLRPVQYLPSHSRSEVYV